MAVDFLSDSGDILAFLLFGMFVSLACLGVLGLSFISREGGGGSVDSEPCLLLGVREFCLVGMVGVGMGGSGAKKPILSF